MSMQISDAPSREVVVITGSSGGVGRAVAEEFGRHGARVALIARGEDGLEAAKRAVEAAGGSAIAIPADVSHYDEVERAAARVEEAFGPIDIWVNVAFTNCFGEFWEIEPEEYRRVTEVSYFGFVWGTRAALKRMRPRDRGTIVQVGSALAYRSIPLQSAYCGAKSAIRGFTDSIRCELLHHGSNVRITMAQLPAVNTPQFSWNRVKGGLRHPQPVPPIYEPEVIARSVYWAAHTCPREMWIGFSTVMAILAQKFVPALADRYLGKTGYASQQTPDAIAADRPDNLFEPADADRDFGSHGEFDAQAHRESWEAEAIMHRGWLVGGLALAGAAAGALALAQRGK